MTLTHPPSSSAVVKKGQSYTSTPPIGRTVCTQPQCLYKGALNLLPFALLPTTQYLQPAETKLYVARTIQATIYVASNNTLQQNILQCRLVHKKTHGVSVFSHQ
jgi:hypothetical protein